MKKIINEIPVMIVTGRRVLRAVPRNGLSTAYSTMNLE